MLLALWSPKGGSGTSVVAASLALGLAARHGRARLVDPFGDQLAILGLGAEPEHGLTDWLATAPDVAADGLDRLAVGAGAGVLLLPPGAGSVGHASAAAGRALAAALRESSLPAVADLGGATEPALAALRDDATHPVLLLRSCYLALRRAVRDPSTFRSVGVIVVEERGRGLPASEIADLVDLPLLGVVPDRFEIGRAVDAGVLVTRPPEPLVRAIDDVVDALDVLPLPEREA